MPSFKEYLINEAKSLNYNPEFVFANKQVFDADFAVHPSSTEAQKVVSKIQQPKIDDLAQKLDITWTMLFANSHEQHDRWRGTSRTVWSYIIVGNDPTGNEIAYYKYEAGPGSGQSHVYGNRKNKTKLTWILDSTPGEARVRLGIAGSDVKKSSKPIPLDVEKLQRVLKTRFKKFRFTHDNRGQLRMVSPPFKGYGNTKSAYSFSFKPYRNKVIVKYQRLYDAKEVKQGFRTEVYYDKATRLGSYDDMNQMAAAIRLHMKEMRR